MADTHKLFRGVLTALVTPMHEDGRVDDEALVKLVEAQLAAGVHGLVPCGTTGEATTLSHAEHIHVVEVVTRAVAGRVPVLAGAGSNSTREAIELTRACKELGVDGTLQVVPYYNKPPQAGLIRHFEAIADAVDLPIVLYNVPSRTVRDLLPETVGVLARHPNIVGIKEATGDMHRAVEVREAAGEEFCLLSGDDFTMLPFFAVGGDGIISVVSNPAPKLVVDLFAATCEGDLPRAQLLNRQQLQLTRLLFTEPNPIPAKATTMRLGLGGPTVRSPLVPLDPDAPLQAQLDACMRELGLIA
ncbi:4-hydroxy-tetrahydrodipicolinate synthase [Pseudenhygromyxa sp. WMMC2535]|uniref:4-hydroxy-tetrahydrodipicolinate synthase n=1 Tax=Pseudenhygromyxa sp. WMMC2535 TaxID=2712867 RepID=UPI0015548FFF|nr:4-hydroxy-tetrahydrodipicolinate synthase [Pseudenhygromyxa sp. WMMC2535]NVB39166.1 4-hydroxy-tetrahydrodipicolinate synthase [Pseudenhygromyxa sp. WMMC2535]